MVRLVDLEAGTPSRTGGTTTKSTPTDTKSHSGSGTTGGGATTGGSGSGSAGSGSGSAGSGGVGTGGKSTGTPTADPSTMKVIKAGELTCCANIYFRSTKGEMNLVAENPFQGKFEGRKVSFQLTGKDGKVVPASKYRIVNDSDNNIVIDGVGLTGNGYRLKVSVTGTSESETFTIKLI